MIKKLFIVLVMFFVLLFNSCYTHKIDTAQEWCEQISGVDLNDKYNPPWSLFFGVHISEESIRDDYAKILNDLYMKQVQHRIEKIDRMVWREGKNLHMTNLSSFFIVVEPSSMVNEIKEGIEDSCNFKIEDKARKCLYGTMVTLFDKVIIHHYSNVSDELWVRKGDDFRKNKKDYPAILETKTEEYKRFMEKVK